MPILAMFRAITSNVYPIHHLLELYDFVFVLFFFLPWLLSRMGFLKMVRSHGYEILHIRFVFIL